MKITFEMHGVLRRLAGAELAAELPDHATVGDALDHLSLLLPAAAAQLRGTACALGTRLVPRFTELPPGARVALIPPVSGG